MKFIIIGKNIDVTPGLREAVESKLGKLERYFTPETEINVTLSVEKGRQKIEVTIPVKGNIIRSEQTSNDMYVSIDLVEEIIERQLRKYKNKLVAREQEGGNFKQEFFEEDDKIEDAGEIKIVRTKKFAFTPLYILRFSAMTSGAMCSTFSYSAYSFSQPFSLASCST